MTIDEYIKKRGLSVSDFARQIGVSPATVYRWKHGSRPNAAQIEKIVGRTDGAIRLADAIGGVK